MTRVPVQPRLLKWAADRAGWPTEAARQRFPKYGEWLAGTVQPTFKQLQDFARATYAPVGYFFLTEPPALKLPIPYLRTPDNRRPPEPSPDLLDTVGVCQQRQEWYAGYARAAGAEALPFVGTLTVRADVLNAANAIRRALGFDLSVRQRLPTWEEALRQFIQQADDLGVLVMVSGVVGSNNTRVLDTAEFRGFALSDPAAPLVFVNGADTKSGQMFTLAHELAHLWLGQSALTDATAASEPQQAVEQWCNRVAAEVLVPLEAFRLAYRRAADVVQETQRLAKAYKVSTLVVLRRMYDANGLTRERFWQLYDAEVVRLVRLMKSKAGGGDFYRTTTSRISSRFTRAVVASALEGRATYNEAFRLLGVQKMSTFTELGRHVGIDVGGSGG